MTLFAAAPLDPAELTIVAIAARLHYDLRANIPVIVNRDTLPLDGAAAILRGLKKPVTCVGKAAGESMSLECTPIERISELEDWKAWVKASVEDDVAYLRRSYGQKDVLFQIANLGAVISLDSYAEWQRDYNVPGLAFGIRDQIPQGARPQVRATLMLWNAPEDQLKAKSGQELEAKP